MPRIDSLIQEIIDTHGTRERFPRGCTFVLQGSRMPHMYYLVRGKVKVEQSVISGKSILFGFSGQGSWLGDLELFSDAEVAHSTVSTVTELETIRFSLDTMRAYIKSRPVVTEMFARSLARKMWANSKTSTVNLLYPLRDRYAAYLYEMSTDSTELPIALETSAGLLGAGERQLQRVLRDLAEAGLVARSGRTLTVLDRDGLQRIASELLR
jgi:CRP-like cAMP-binding protein